MGGASTVGRTVALVSTMVIAVAVAGHASPAWAAAAPTKGNLHIEYSVESTISQHIDDTTADETGDGTININWDVASDVSLKAVSSVPYRYTDKKKSVGGPVTANGTYKVIGTAGGKDNPVTVNDCSGALQIDPTSAQNVATFEVDFVKAGAKLTSKATLYADPPDPTGAGVVGMFTAGSGTNCATQFPIRPITLTAPPKGPKALAVKIDLAQVAAAKGKTKTYPVGDSDTVTDSRTGSVTKWSWDGTMTLTLTK